MGTTVRLLAVIALSLLAGLPDASARSRKIDVGGYRLKIHCSGRGQPAVILESGVGDSHLTWTEVQPKVAKFTRVCSYDRAGLLESDSGPLPRTGMRIASELDRLLVRAKVKGPYIMVGHSFGGIVVRTYSILHPDKVAGIVLVEATHEDFPALAPGLRSRAERRRSDAILTLAGAAARSEVESMAASAEDLRRAGPPPEVPTIVITAGDREDSPPMLRLWTRLQEDLADSPSVLRHVIAERSGHDVPFDEPEIVVEAIRELVTRVREAP